jgi:hypothetical protein
MFKGHSQFGTLRAHTSQQWLVVIPDEESSHPCDQSLSLTGDAPVPLYLSVSVDSDLVIAFDWRAKKNSSAVRPQQLHSNYVVLGELKPKRVPLPG